LDQNENLFPEPEVHKYTVGYSSFLVTIYVYQRANPSCTIHRQWHEDWKQTHTQWSSLSSM